MLGKPLKPPPEESPLWLVVGALAAGVVMGVVLGLLQLAGRGVF